MQGKCVIFSAPSGSGKTTIVNHLLKKPELKLEFSISATTRPARNNEINGKDYYFLSPEEFKKKIENNELIEWEEVYNNTFYGTPKSEPERIWGKGNIVTFDVDVKGGLNLKKIFGSSALSVFVMPPSLQVLEKRLLDRKTESVEIIKQRLSRAEYELSFALQFDACIVNDNLEKCIAEAYNRILEFITYH